MRLIPKENGRIEPGGSIRLHGRELTDLSEKEMRSIRGQEIGMIFQDPMTSLIPVLTIGEQIIEGVIRHRSISRKKARQEAADMLEMVGISNPVERMKQYPHQFSGGMRQRVMIAMALIMKPAVLIADEPTTALDVTVQAQILELFKQIQQQTGVALILITHDLGVVAQVADRVHVMYAGQIAETASVRRIFAHPQHPYTRGLLQSVPRLDADRHQPLVPVHGTPPDLIRPPTGCPFYLRCEYAMAVCKAYAPPVTHLHEGHLVNCWLQDERAKQIRFASVPPGDVAESGDDSSAVGKTS
jgi:dipeptide transport system ATP-binding protein